MAAELGLFYAKIEGFSGKISQTRLASTEFLHSPFFWWLFLHLLAGAILSYSPLSQDPLVPEVIFLTVVQKTNGGGIDLQVLNVGTDVSANQTQEITIPIRILTETGQALKTQ